jgi:hypothetical protein
MALALRAMICRENAVELWCVGDEPVPGTVAGWLGIAWCPTPSALSQLREAGLEPRPAPELSVLQTVNHRAFGTGLVSGLENDLPGERFVHSMAELDAALAGVPVPTDGFLLKRPFGFAGRWRKRVRGELVGADRRGAEASMGGYGVGLQVETWVEVVQDLALPGLLGADGLTHWGKPTLARGDPEGGFVASRVATAGELSLSEARALSLGGKRVAAALHAAGYFGPFGVDAFRWRAADGRVRLRSVSEINARFTMGWWTGMGPGWWRCFAR